MLSLLIGRECGLCWNAKPKRAEPGKRPAAAGGNVFNLLYKKLSWVACRKMI